MAKGRPEERKHEKHWKQVLTTTIDASLLEAPATRARTAGREARRSASPWMARRGRVSFGPAPSATRNAFSNSLPVRARTLPTKFRGSAR